MGAGHAAHEIIPFNDSFLCLALELELRTLFLPNFFFLLLLFSRVRCHAPGRLIFVGTGPPMAPFLDVIDRAGGAHCLALYVTAQVYPIVTL